MYKGTYALIERVEIQNSKFCEEKPTCHMGCVFFYYYYFSSVLQHWHLCNLWGQVTLPCL